MQIAPRIPKKLSLIHILLLSKLILETLVELEEHPTNKAIEFLKKEVNELF